MAIPDYRMEAAYSVTGEPMGKTIDMMQGHKWPERSQDGTCYLCGLRTWQAHDDPLHCIEELRVAMIKQRATAESLALDISTRFLAVLEELAAHPECGYSGYVTYNPQTGNKEQLPLQKKNTKRANQ